MAHQVLCIESASDVINHVKKGEVYSSTGLSRWGIQYRGVDMWHSLEELSITAGAHVSLFVDLPNQEGQSFSKKVDEPVKIEKKELVEQD